MPSWWVRPYATIGMRVIDSTSEWSSLRKARPDCMDVRRRVAWVRASFT